MPMLSYLLLLAALLPLAGTQPQAAAQDLDTSLLQEAKRFRIQALAPLPPKNQALYEVGRALFQDQVLSGNRNISCKTCHDPRRGGADGMMLSIGQGRDAGKQGQGVVLPRHSPSIFDLGQKDARQLFWDSRVSLHFSEWKFETPEPRLNGLNPPALEIFTVFRRAADVQALFPLRSPDEMLGRYKENDLAQSQDNLKIWENLVTRLRAERSDLMQKLSQAYQLASSSELNIGHIGGSLGEFIAYAFQAGQTPLDRYLRGDLQALSARQKLGFSVYLGEGRCSSCHNSPLLSNGVVMNIGVAPLKTKTQKLDLGRYNLTQDPWDYAMFKTPRLRNIKLSAPYMHNGIYKNLSEVLDHYENVYTALYEFTPDAQGLKFYSTQIFRIEQESELHKIADTISPLIERPVKFKPDQREALLDFLENALTDESYLQNF
jgi:cytochrome c peroxidase